MKNKCLPVLDMVFHLEPSRRVAGNVVRVPCPLKRALDAGATSQDESALLSLIAGAGHATGAVVGPGARDLEFGHGVARFAPAGDGIKDDFYGGRSHLSEV
jgi:hypothetical protein